MPRFSIIVPRFVRYTGELYAFPLGLAYIASSLKHHGYAVEWLNLNHSDQPLDKQIQAVFHSRETPVVLTGGLSVHFNAVFQIIKCVKERLPDCLCIIGGGLVSSEPEILLQGTCADIGVIGEGEETIVELAAVLDDGTDVSVIPGIVYRNIDGRIEKSATRPVIRDLDRLPVPDYEGFDLESYLNLQRPSDAPGISRFDTPRAVPIILSRSCPYQCTFCYHPLGNTYRRRSLDSFFAEMESLISQYKVNLFNISDELFAYDRDILMEICRRIKPLNVRWLAQLRVDSVDEDLLAAMKSSGLFYISYGLESASNPILRSMKKKITVSQIDKALKMTRKQGIQIQGNFLFGDRAETWETAMETLIWWQRHPQYHINLAYVLTYPGSDNYAYCLETGRIKDPLDFLKKGCPQIDLTSMDTDTRLKLKQALYEVRFKYRFYGRVTSADSLGFDAKKQNFAYRLTVVCPHCSEASVYHDFVLPQEIFPRIQRIACRQCNLRFDILPGNFDHLKPGIQRLNKAVADLIDGRVPIFITPWITEFREVMKILDVDYSALNILGILDNDLDKVGKKFINGYPTHRRDGKALGGYMDQAVMLVLPSRHQAAIYEDLRNNMNITEERIVLMQIDES